MKFILSVDAVIEKDGKLYAISGRLDHQTVLAKNLVTDETEVIQMKDVSPLVRVTVDDNQTHLEFSFDSCNSTAPEAEDRKRSPERSLDADYPLSAVQIDHTLMDVMVVDEEDALRCGRPWVAMVIDAHTRMALGVFISSDRPELTD